MVCQSAGQTRFRALKHENGTAGSATIIVKVIACFQPLDDCQVRYDCYFHLLIIIKCKKSHPTFILLLRVLKKKTLPNYSNTIQI